MQPTPWYLLDFIVGFDEEGEGGEEGEEGEEGSEEEEGEEEEEEEEEESSDEKKTYTEDEVKGLKSGLQKERKDRKEAQNKVRQLEREKATRDGKEKSAEQREADERAKSERLATKLRDTAVDNAITKLATSKKFRFRDTDDALRLINRADIEVDQDDDDPAEIEIDEDTVEAALKELASKKPHLLLAEGDEEPSGGRFNGKSKSKDGLSDDVLRDRYSALRRGTPANQ